MLQKALFELLALQHPPGGDAAAGAGWAAAVAPTASLLGCGAAGVARALAVLHGVVRFVEESTRRCQLLHEPMHRAPCVEQVCANLTRQP